ncbi:ABC transporter ATP-binding protein [Methylocella sp.]|uniref:ABC transporter ATP-binding protein n=1 Tax=Methylocella sp. TaxID=1978226 RepID=UPI003783C177
MIRFENVGKSFGATRALDGVSFEIAEGAFCALLGPSGCGKSTLLRMINVMVEPDQGRVLLRGADVARLDPVALRRSIGYCIQSVGLFPHWSVRDNIAATPRLLGWSRARVAARIDEVCAALGVDEALLSRRPRELSGGQQQRVGVARALAADPDLLLMDEPFSALDPVSRAALQAETRRLRRDGGKTIVFVTHDVDEATSLATQIAVLNAGRLVQSAAPADMLSRPADAFVADFLDVERRPQRLLDLIPVADRLRPFRGVPGPALRKDASLREALDMMIARHVTVLPVADEFGAPCGEILLSDVAAGPRP